MTSDHAVCLRRERPCEPFPGAAGSRLLPSLTAGAPRPDVVWLPASLPPTPPAWLSGKVVLCTRSPLHPGQMGRAAPHSGLEAAATEGRQGLSGLMEPI